jgi:glucose/mannose-6-phosphate isomerase
MKTYIEQFPKQLRNALAIGKEAKITLDKTRIQHIIVIGMGGSGIGANFAAEFCKAECPVPYLTCKGYELPAFVGKNSLVIASSYSGNTEETLIALEAAMEQGAQVICIASGGRLIDVAIAKGMDYIQIPNEGAPPRACLGYSLVQQLVILARLGFIAAERLDEVAAAADLLEREQALIQEKAKKIAPLFVGKFPILYATERHEAVVVRLRQQLNENSKILCSHHVIPEMNHNELVGWRKQPTEFLVIIFRSNDDHPRNQARIAINKEVIRHFTNTLIEVFLKGKNLIEQAFYGVHLGDFLSWEVAQLREVDPTEVKVIDYLKGELAKH